MSAIALVASWLTCLALGLELGGRWSAWVARRAAERIGVWEPLQRSIEQMAKPRNWRNP